HADVREPPGGAAPEREADAPTREVAGEAPKRLRSPRLLRRHGDDVVAGHRWADAVSPLVHEHDTPGDTLALERDGTVAARDQRVGEPEEIRLRRREVVLQIDEHHGRPGRARRDLVRDPCAECPVAYDDRIRRTAPGAAAREAGPRHRDDR